MNTQPKRTESDVLQLRTPRRRYCWFATIWRPKQRPQLPAGPRGVVIEFPRKRISSDGAA